MAFHNVFISYSTLDLKTVWALVDSLERKGLACWFSDRDIPPAADWTREIVKAIDACSVVVFVLSENSNRDDSGQIGREIIYTVAKKKPLVPFRVDGVTPSGGIGLQLTSVNYLDAYQRRFEPCVVRLAEVVQSHMTVNRRPPPPPPPPPDPQVAPPWRTIVRWGVIAGAATFGLAAVALAALNMAGVSGDVTPAAAKPALAALQAQRWDEAVSLANAADPNSQAAGWPSLIRAQADYCAYLQTRDTAKRDALLAQLSPVVSGRGDWMAEAQFRLGAQYAKGGLTDQPSPEEAAQRARQLLTASAAGGYQPAQVFLNALTNDSKPTPKLANAAVDSADTWPPGLYPTSCGSGDGAKPVLDLNWKRWTDQPST